MHTLVSIVHQALAFSWSRYWTNSSVHKTKAIDKWCSFVENYVSVVFELDGTQNSLIPIHDTMSVVVIYPIHYSIIYHTDFRDWPSKHRDHVRVATRVGKSLVKDTKALGSITYCSLITFKYGRNLQCIFKAMLCFSTLKLAVHSAPFLSCKENLGYSW